MSANPYDPVTTTDSTHLADDDWGLNLPSIRYRNYGSSRFKQFCNFVRERSRLIVIIGCVLIVGIVLIAVIVASTQGSSGRKPADKDKEEKWQSPAEGMAFYPVPQDGSTVISFFVHDKVNPMVKNLNEITEEYQLQHQFNSSIYTDCTANTNPPNKVCRLGNHHFGDECTRHKYWGYPHAMPCIFLQLNLPDNMMIRPIPPDSLLWSMTSSFIGSHNDSTYIPVTCEGATKHDRLLLGVHGFDKQNPDPIQYYPPDGFPSFFYRQRDTSLPFIKPAMMVRLTSLRDDLMVKIDCTAWGQLFDYEGKMLDHKLLRTQFAVYMRGGP